MIRIVYIGKEIKNRIKILKNNNNYVVDIINDDDIINKLPNDVIDLFIINNQKSNVNSKIIKTNKRLSHIPVISLIKKVNDVDQYSDIIISRNISDIEFLYQVRTLIKMKLIDDELKKEKILLEIKVKDRTNELENKAERLRITFNSIGDGVIVTNEIGIIVSMNPIAMKLCEVDVNDFIMKNIDDIFDIYKNKEKINIFELISKTKETYLLSDDVILKTKSGKELIISDSASPMLNRNGNLMGIVVVFRDNTEEYHTKKQLIDSEERFRNMFDNMKNAVCIYKTNDNGKTFFINGWNIRAMKLENVKTEKIIGKNLSEIFPFAIESGFVKYIRKVWETGKSIQVPDFYYESVDKKIKGWRTNFLYKNFVTDEVVSIYDDITSRKEAEDLIKLNVSRLRRAEITSKSGNWELHLDSNTMIGSEGALKLYGFFDNEINYELVKKAVLPEYRNYLNQSLKNLIESDIPYDAEFKIKRVGTKEIIDIHSSAIFDKEKRIVFGTIQDITYRKLQEVELENTISLLKATLESTADGILVSDSNGNVVRFNQRFKNIWNLTDNITIDEINKDSFNYMIKELKDSNIILSDTNYLHNYSGDTSFDLLEFKDGRYIERYSLPQIINGKIVGRVWSFRDITERKRVESDLIEAKNKAEESDRLKTEFLANMTHEIRTPMNSILGFTSLLNKNTPPNKMDDYINIIKSSGQLLMSIIEDIIDLSKIQSGIFKIEKECCDIKEMMIRTEEEYNQHLKLKNKENLKLVLNIDKGKCKTYSDIKRIKQVLNNLIGNATKFTINGTITYGYKKSNKYITFYVNDTGIGISDEHINKIFERFYQVQNKNNKKQDGTGLGLTISKAIVELLGGNIWVESQIGIGSTFYFSIPIETENKTIIEEPKLPKPVIKDINWTTKNILVLDDDNTNYELIELLLTGTKINIDRSNIDEYSKILSDKKYDIILINYHSINSCDNIIQLYKLGIPIIIELEYPDKNQITKIKNIGINNILYKPLTWINLFNIINNNFIQ